ncbi:four helix bundle protein [Chryseobacterium tongliaoense]|uniref:four helix bundle protein n=1 Tax=Chryseobacterium tongliaoense TaxID=3240933 RepID=UPI003F7A44C9
MAVEFEKFEVYQLTVNLTKNIFSLLNNDKFRKEFELTSQIKRAVLSISNNISEGASITIMHSL